MKIKRHGISIGIERTGSDYFLYLKAIGRLTHEDYERLTPLLESALEGVREPRIKALIDARDFEGWELRAAWDDFKLGLKHGSEFARVAVLGDEKWQEIATHIAAWFVSGEVRYFEESDEALEWLAQPLAKQPAKSADADRGDRPTFPAHT
ncbi:STAS/SEC14 domain-containing protein [Microbulbifer magnicolonia]|uniref:STAS/SEC14 domain-containing protein n=1 Tax=Microbulbifer magnicolonia TaxID=3109744 RepID=UPI002B40B51F|nr:STAS/SEC14 domain-containing protein [Microbulbifer sp. GG15]